MKMNEEDLLAPASIEDPEPKVAGEEESEEEREVRRDNGKPPGYTGPEDRCQFCEYFREFSSPSCRKFGYAADPEGHCDSFEAKEEDSTGTTEESYGNMGDEEEDEAEVEE
mgnify:CR=1 FL=1